MSKCRHHCFTSSAEDVFQKCQEFASLQQRILVWIFKIGQVKQMNGGYVEQKKATVTVLTAVFETLSFKKVVRKSDCSRKEHY